MTLLAGVDWLNLFCHLRESFLNLKGNMGWLNLYLTFGGDFVELLGRKCVVEAVLFSCSLC